MFIFIKTRIFISGFLFFWVFHLASNAQIAPHKYWVQFADKQHSDFSLDKPDEFLSLRAVERREIYNIAYDSLDLPVSQYYCNTIQQLGGKILLRSKWLNGVVVYTTDTTVLDTIRKLSFVKQLRHIRKKKLQTNTVSVVKNSFSSGFNTIYGQANRQITMLKGDFLHHLGYRGEHTLITILDAGFTNADTIPALSAIFKDNRIVATKNFVNQNVSVFGRHSHGTAVLSTMAANDPYQMVGTAPNADFALAITEDAYSEFVIEEYNWVRGLEFADSLGSKIVTTSLGYTQFDTSSQNHTYQDMDGKTTIAAQGAHIAVEKGLLLLVAAANEGNSAWHYIATPADAIDILAVGAVDSAGHYASFSSTGPSVDGRVKPEVAAMGKQSTIIYPDGNIYQGNGTSFATPILCGLTACLWEAFPRKTNLEIRDAILKSSSQYEHPDSLLGYGIPDFQKAFSLLAGTNYLPDTTNPFVFYPNPFTKDFTLALFNYYSGKVDLQIYDTTGRLVLDEDLSNQAMQKIFYLHKLDTWHSGVYFVKLTIDKKTYSQKIIKQ